MSEKLLTIPFDSFTLAAVVHDLQEFVGGKVQDIRQPTDTEVSISLYLNSREAIFLLSCHAQYARAHFITKRLSNQPKPPVFCSTLRTRLEGSRLVLARQIQNDRVLELEFESPLGEHSIVAELMGKHSNLILIDGDARIVNAAKWVGKTMSSRPIQPSSKYELPPVMKPRDFARKSPFLVKLLTVMHTESVPPTAPVISPGHGAYPISVAPLGLKEFPRGSISLALEQHFDVFIPSQAADNLASSLTSRLERLLLARDVVLSDLRQAEEAGDKAARWQRLGELVLAYGASAPLESSTLDAWDYDGTEVKITLDPELDFKANANRYFERAKKAKGRLGMVKDQIARISKDREAILSMIESVRVERRLDRLKDLEKEAHDRRWLNQQVAPSPSKEDRPFQGFKVRELMAPGGYPVLFGENSESNDYLTLRVAKPNDIWLHVRGAVSAHVVIQTNNHPEKVQPETLRFAASVAVKNSKSKHSGYVSVDYTLKKYVRRPKGAAKGAALYTNEKTINVDNV